MITAFRIIGCTVLFASQPFYAASEEFTNAIHAFLQQRVEVERRDDGIVVGLVDSNGISVISCGEMDNDTNQEVNGDTVFEIGSITKTFTGLLLQDMVARKEMKLDDPVAKYLPASVKVPTYNGKQITLLELATHTSGLPTSSITWVPKRADDPRADCTVQRLYDFVSGYQLTREPGTKYEYSTVGMALLGQAIALEAGTNYESLVKDWICRPLKMDSTGITLTPELENRFATGHNYSGYAVPASSWGAWAPGAALRSTANDLLKYVSANLGLTETSLTPLMKETQAVHFHAHLETDTGLDTDIGLAWMITRELDGTEIIRHGGLTDGFIAFIGMDMNRCRGVVVLANSLDTDIPIIGRILLESEWQSDRRPKETKISEQLYDSYVGQYQQNHTAGESSQPVIGIRREGEHLFARAVGSKSWPFDVLMPPVTVELLPESENRFFERLNGMPVIFSRDSQGNLNVLTIHYEGKTTFYAKVSDKPPKAFQPPKPCVAIKLNSESLDAIVGRYEFPPKAPFPSGAKAVIWREGDQLTCQIWGENAIQGAFDIYPESETNFFVKIDGAQLRFTRNLMGKIVSVVYHSYQARIPDCEGKKVDN